MAKSRGGDFPEGLKADGSRADVGRMSYRNEFLMRGWAKWALAAILAAAMAVAVASVIGAQERDNAQRVECIERALSSPCR